MVATVTIKNNISTMFNKNTYTIYRNHPTRRAAMILCALLITLLPGKVWGQTTERKLVDVPQAFSLYDTKTYTITSASGYRMRANDDGTAIITESNSSNTGDNYQFAFVPDNEANPTKFYLYNIGAKAFLGYKTTSTTSEFHSDNDNIQAIYVYTPGYAGTEKVSFSADDFPYVFTFNGEMEGAISSKWNTSSSSTNTTSHVFQCGNGFVINDWTFIGTGGNNSFKVEVAADFDDEDKNIARSNVKNYVMRDFNAMNLTTDSKVYSLLAENGRYLSATNNGLGGSTSAGTNEQFLFFTKPAVTGSAKGEGGVRRADGATEVYLYSVGQKKFLTATKVWTASSADTAPIYVFSTNDAHDYSLAFSTNATWAIDDATIGTDNATSSSAPSKANRFKAEAVTTDAAQIAAEANTIYTGVYTRVTNLSDLNDSEGNQLSEEKVYYITSDAINAQNGHVIIGGSGSSLGWYTQNSGEGIDNLRSQYHASTRFAIVSCNDNFYLYSVNANKAVKDDATLVAGETSIQPIYLYATNNTDFPVAFGFSATWDAERAKNIDGSCNGNDRGKLISSSTAIGSAKRFKLTVVTDDRYNLSDARTTLRGYYTPSTFSATGEGTKLVTDNKVYTLKSKAGKTLYANQYGQGLSVKTTSDADDGNVLAQFVFYQDPTDGSTNVYLYSVGRGQFVTSTNGFDKSAPQSAIHVFDTENTSYPYAFGFADTWTGGSVINAGSTLTFAASSPLDANRFMATDVTTESPYVVGEAKDIYDGVYAVSSISNLQIDITDKTKRIDPNKVYLVVSDYNGSYSYLFGIGTDNKINHNSRSSSSGYNDGDKTTEAVQYAFVTDEKGRVYFYNVGHKKALSDTEYFISGTEIKGVTLYDTHDRKYPLALAFSTPWNTTENVKTVHVGGNSKSGVSDNSYDGVDDRNSLSFYNRFKLVEVTNETYTPALARKYLSVPNNVDEVITTDLHYKGVHGRDFKKRGTGNNKMQDVAEYHYYYYIDNTTTAQTVPLMLTLMSYSGGGNPYEPRGYYRWYDLNTDAMPAGDRLQKAGGNNSSLKQVWRVSNDGAVNYGWFGYHLTASPTHERVGVTLSVPSKTDNPNWKGDIVACDVSRYTDYSIALNADTTGIYTGAGNTSGFSGSNANNYPFRHEPTLSIRYIFHVLPATVMADSVMNGLLTEDRVVDERVVLRRDRTMNDKGILVFGMKDPNATMNLRTDLTDPKYYFFHPLKEEAKTKNHHVYYNEADADKYKYQEGDFDKDKLVQATGFTWRVYAQDPTTHEWYWRTFRNTKSARSFAICLGDPTTDDRGVDANVNRLTDTNKNGSFYHPLDQYEDKWPSTTPYTKTADLIQSPGNCYIVGYLVNGKDSVPFFNAELQMNNTDYPMTDEQRTAHNRDDRDETFMADKFGSAKADFTFDDENGLLTTGSPADYSSTTDFRNVKAQDLSSVPSPFSWRQFSFIYTALANYQSTNGNAYLNANTPGHGDFCLYKTYGTGNTDVPWLLDRTAVTTNKQRYGYFLYTDASDESRVIGTQDFVGTLCGGTRLYISAYVSNIAPPGDNNINDMPELRFTLYGVNKNAQKEDVSQKIFASICSGKLKNNTEDWETGTDKPVRRGYWYQVYGSLVLPMNKGIENYTDFRIAIDNMCNSTNGADYAVDEITVFQNPSRLTVIQTPGLCEEIKPNVPNDVTITIKGDYNVLRELSQAESGADKTVYYRFCKADGTPMVTETTDENPFYGQDGDERHDKYGVATLPASYSESAKFTGKTEGNVADKSVNRFEGTAYNPTVVLESRSFALEKGTSYYVSVAFSDPGNEASWSKPSNQCSVYSKDFQLVEQEVVVNGAKNSVPQVHAACGSDNTTNYDAISVALTAPDQTFGGTKTLNGLTFDWYLGAEKDLTKVTIEGNTSNLFDALLHYRTNNSESGVDAFEDYLPNGVYTADDYALLKHFIGANKLQLSASSSLSGLPLPLGLQTIHPIPTKQSFTIDGIDYRICDRPLLFTVRVLRSGPAMTLGIKGIDYPSDQSIRRLRLGFPQIRAMYAVEGEKGTLRVPIMQRDYEEDKDIKEDLLFTDGTNAGKKQQKVYICDTNDPSFTDPTAITDANWVANVAYDDCKLKRNEITLNLCDIDTTKLHEGYWYELQFNFKRYFDATQGDKDPGGTQCESSTYLILEIVPEYVTWTPTADNYLSTNWNNDANWRRATAEELLNPAYTDYRESSYDFTLYQSDYDVTNNSEAKATSHNGKTDTRLTANNVQPYSYTPMYFTNVVIPNLTDRPYPMLGFIRHRQDDTRLVMRMTNDKHHEPTSNIQYDMMASPVPDEDGHFVGVSFDGNVCNQIHFMSGGQLRNQQYLTYKKAWVDLSVNVGEWTTVTTPMARTYSGDLYMPKGTARQATPLFQDITMETNGGAGKTDAVVKDEVDVNGLPWTETSTGTKYGFYGKAGANLYSRLRLPVYQKLWGKDGMEYDRDDDGGKNSYSSYDNPLTMIIYPSSENGDMVSGNGNEQSNVWSHAFNALGQSLSAGADDLTTEGVFENGAAIAMKVGDDYATPAEGHNTEGNEWKSVKAVIRLPKADSKFWFYQLDRTSGKAKESKVTSLGSQDIDRTDNYKLGIPTVDVETENALGQQSLTTSKLSPSELKYDLVGNPYMASISVQKFVEGNEGILLPVKRKLTEGSDVETEVNRVWVLSGSEILELDPSNTSSTILPGQGFFINVKNPGEDKVLFTTSMQVDPTVAASQIVSQAKAAAKIYTIGEVDGIRGVIEEGTLGNGMRACSPAPGWIGIVNDDGERSGRARIYTVDGRMVCALDCAASSMTRHYTGSGIFVVRMTTADGKTEVRKMAVR